MTRVALLAVALRLAQAAGAGEAIPQRSPTSPVSAQFGALLVTVDAATGAITVANASSMEPLLQQNVSWGGIVAASTAWTDLSQYVYEGYLFRLGGATAVYAATGVASAYQAAGSLIVTYGTNDTAGGTTVNVTFSQGLVGGAPSPAALSIQLAALDGNGAPAADVAWLGLGFASGAGDAYYGTGERFFGTMQRGATNDMYCFVEDGGWGLGTELRLPKGPFSTYAPMPWLIVVPAEGSSGGRG
jgi:hypothetical protein